jgi:hypothetical protein
LLARQPGRFAIECKGPRQSHRLADRWWLVVTSVGEQAASRPIDGVLSWPAVTRSSVLIQRPPDARLTRQAEDVVQR